MFVTRLISGIVLVAVALLTICSGGWILYGTLTIVSLIGMFGTVPCSEGTETG